MEIPLVKNFSIEIHRQFKSDLDHYMTQIVLGSVIRGRRDSVLIDDKSKDRIRSHIYALKECIDSADITDAKRASLIKKLSEFESLLEKKRINLMHVTLVAMEIMALPGGIWSSADVAHKLITNVLTTVAEAKAAEDELRRLPPVTTQAALSPPRRTELAPSNSDASHWSPPPDLDEEIPF
jgi:hypothetical protein